ncbi:MAG: hypothetical protein HC913_02735 [Microscillaceae bacterium]|nr:hypothetical protein [Microscillaceae bacterium]
MRGYEMSFELGGLEVAQLQEEGRVLLRYQNQLVDKLCGNARIIQIGTHSVPAVNSSTLQSEIGNQLCQRYPSHPFALVYFDGADKRYFSLRSIGSFDVAAIAGQFGGWGHKNAAGFAMPLV